MIEKTIDYYVLREAYLAGGMTLRLHGVDVTFNQDDCVLLIESGTRIHRENGITISLKAKPEDVEAYK